MAPCGRCDGWPRPRCLTTVPVGSLTAWRPTRPRGAVGRGCGSLLPDAQGRALAAPQGRREQNPAELGASWGFCAGGPGLAAGGAGRPRTSLQEVRVRPPPCHPKMHRPLGWFCLSEAGWSRPLAYSLTHSHSSAYPWSVWGLVMLLPVRCIEEPKFKLGGGLAGTQQGAVLASLSGCLVPPKHFTALSLLSHLPPASLCHLLWDASPIPAPPLEPAPPPAVLSLSPGCPSQSPHLVLAPSWGS